MLKIIGRLMVVLAITLVSAQVTASIIWDYSPEATSASLIGDYRNIASGQNFVERVLFDTDVDVLGMDIYTASSTNVPLGFGVTVRVWEDNGGLPGSLIDEFLESISVIDSDGIGTLSNMSRYHADFASSISLSSGVDYWIGMSGTSQEFGVLGLGGVNAPDDGKAYKMIGSTPHSLANTGDMAFRLYGNVVPTPATLALFTIGLAGLGWSRRKKS